MPSAVKPPQTLYDKVFEDHIVEEKEDGTVLLYIGMSLRVNIVVWQALTGYRQASCS
jgi:homoaconitase/3-isopropylmalate dehydratase large subunit